MLKILAVGCSMTKGHGLPGTIHNPDLWVNRLFPRGTHIKNVSKSGANNHWIFLETMSEIMQEKYDIVLVGWSAIPRFNFQVGLELWPVETMFSGSRDIDLNSHTKISGKWLNKIGDDLRKLSNDHWDILELVKYVNVLIEIQENLHKGKIFFVNTLGPWPEDYFVYKKINLPSDLSDYEQTLLEVPNRDDDEIFRLYDMIHSQYAKYGGIKIDKWLNLYRSLKSMQIDDAAIDDNHPGIESQKVFVDYLYTILKQKMGI